MPEISDKVSQLAEQIKQTVNPSIDYRDLGAGDIDTIRALWEGLEKHHDDLSAAEWPGITAPPQYTFEDYKKELLGQQGQLHTRVAQHDGVPVGYIQSRSGGEYPKIMSLYTDPKYRGQGIADALMKAEMALLQSKASKKPIQLNVHEPNKSVIPFYRRYGFEPTDITMKMLTLPGPDQIKQATDGPHKYSCVMAVLDKKVADTVASLSQKIADEDLADDGRETDPHITVLYGLHTNDFDEVWKVVTSHACCEFKIKLGKTSIFDSKETGKDYDVVKIEVKEASGLGDLNALLVNNLDVTQTHADYKPHVTLAYVKAGTGKKYAGWDDLDGTEVAISRLVFSPAEGDKKGIKLTGTVKDDIKAASRIFQDFLAKLPTV